MFDWKRYLAPDPKEARARKDKEDALLKAVGTALATGDIATCQSLRTMLETTPEVPESVYKMLLEGIASLNVRAGKLRLAKSLQDNRFAGFSVEEQALIKVALEQLDETKAITNPEVAKAFGAYRNYIQ